MNGLRYTLLLEEPVLANSLAGDTNSARSLPYVPGGLMRGALIGAYTNGSDVDASNEEFRRLFLNGKTRYLPAYPESREKRALPAPLAWKVAKHADGRLDPLFNFAVQINNDQHDLKTVSFDFCELTDGQISSLDQEWNINVHTQRDAVYGRAMGQMDGEDEVRGAVFRYEALPAGLRLQGLIFASTTEDEKTIRTLLENRSLMLGKARTAGYGSARVEKIESIKNDWRDDYWPWEIPSGPVKSFTLTFLSPAILRDANGQFTLDPTDALKARGVEVKVDRIFRSAEIVGGFNRKWGLPLPQSWAIAAGSVFVFTANTTGKALQDLEEQGLGERLAEGFGCVAVDASQPAKTKWRKAVVNVSAIQATKSKSASSQELGNLVLKRLLRRDLDAKVLAFVSAATRDYKGSLTGSQLSRWRVILRSVSGANDPGNLQRLTNLFDKEHERASVSWKKLERVRIHLDGQTPRLTEWLDSALRESDQPWLMLGYGKGQIPSRTAGSLSYIADESLRFEYRIRIIDALFAALGKKVSKLQTKKKVQNG